MIESYEHSDHPIARQLSEVAESLSQENFNKGPKSIINSPREYPIKDITPPALQNIALLPFEIMIAGFRDRTTLITGGWDSPMPDYKTAEGDVSDSFAREQIMRTARFTLHNDPNWSAASSADHIVGMFSVSDIDLVISHSGILAFKSNLKRVDTFARRELLLQIAALRHDSHLVKSQLKNDLIEAWVSWGDLHVQDLCDYMNGKITWADCKNKINE